MDAATVTARLAEIHRDRRWIVAVSVAAAATELVAELQEWGLAGLMVVAGQEGSGDLPNAETFVTRTPAAPGMAGIRAFDAAIAEPAPELREAVARFDPNGEARDITAPHSQLREALGRPVYGARPPAQMALEDKTIVDELWDAAGVARAPAEVVAVREAGRAAGRVAGPLGSVWAADNKEGFHDGGNYMRWVRTADDAAEAVAWFGGRADRVRVMPFLDGIPCSIHGWVTHDGIAVLRPLEMIILRRTDRSGFFYGGHASYWDPPWRYRRAMRHVARAVGRRLVERVGYVGPFGIDGVLTEEGFLPTELNPRMTIGHVGPAEAAGLRSGGTVRAQLAGDLMLEAAWLERALLTAADGRRRGRIVADVAGELPDRTMDVRFTADGAEPADEATRHAGVATGINPTGAAVFVRPEEAHTPPGPSLAPRAVAAIDLVRRTWNLDIPPLAPAPDLFAGQR